MPAPAKSRVQTQQPRAQREQAPRPWDGAERAGEPRRAAYGAGYRDDPCCIHADPWDNVDWRGSGY